MPTGLAPLASPTARTARGRPMRGKLAIADVAPGAISRSVARPGAENQHAGGNREPIVAARSSSIGAHRSSARDAPTDSRTTRCRCGIVCASTRMRASCSRQSRAVKPPARGDVSISPSGVAIRSGRTPHGHTNTTLFHRFMAAGISSPTEQRQIRAQLVNPDDSMHVRQMTQTSRGDAADTEHESEQPETAPTRPGKLPCA